MFEARVALNNKQAEKLITNGEFNKAIKVLGKSTCMGIEGELGKQTYILMKKTYMLFGEPTKALIAEKILKTIP